MKNLRRLRLKSGEDADTAWEKLAEAGVVVHSAVEEEGVTELCGVVPEGFSFESFSFLESVEEIVYQEIDWTEQWEIHGQNFHDGEVEVELPGYPSVFLEPGPGFGDMSHPTTRLVLRLMAREVAGRVVVDVGSGSGVLSLAAVAMGAERVVGVEIDSAAVEHARHNAMRNGMEGKVTFCLPEACPVVENAVVLMNMISSEQEVAWKSVAPRIGRFSCCITSGVRVEELEAYLARAARLGWKLVDQIQEEGWLGLTFKV